jgi:hypothetical protein
MRRWAAIAAAALMLSTLLAFFGSRVVSAVGDLTVRVYTDSDRDGQYDSGEPGVSGVPVSVYNTDNNLLFSVNTNASGLAIFPNTPNGDYRVEVTNPGNGAPNGTVISLPGSTTPGQDNALVFFVTINNAPVQRDVGLRSLDASGVDTGAPAGYRTIVVRAWDDRDANGIQDAGEPGINGLTLGLYNPSDVLVATATTGPDGTYRFVDTVPANVNNYTIRVTGGIPAGYVLTTQNANFDSEDRRDSDAQLVAGEPRITVPYQAQGVNDDSLDVGFSRGAVSGFVWRDLDQNGLRDPGEPFINGVTVELRDSSDNLIGTPQTTRSILNDPANRAGFFEFTSVPLTATYRVRIPNAEFDQSTDLLFGHATPLNQTATPPAIGDQGLVNGTTDGPLVIGAGDFLQTPDFTLNATNRRNETSNFGLYAGTVGDFVWHDVNRNGIVDGGEGALGLAGALLFVDLDSDCLIDTGELTTTTNTSGYYLFDSLPLGVTYTVVLDASNFAPGGALEGLGYTTGAACGSNEGVFITMTTALTATAPSFLNADFGIARAEIGNFVWEDNNGNGIFDLSESGVQSVTVQLYGAGSDGIFFTADDVTVGVSQTTNASGIYTITDIISGTYYATFDLSLLPPAYVASVYTPTGWLSVDPLAANSDDVNDVRAFVGGRVWRTPTFTITRGSQNPGVDAAVFRPVPLSGRVFFDQNGNDQDETSPEPGLANFTVNLRRASDDALVTTTTTLTDGSYTFSSVAPLTYVVEIVRPDPTNWSFVTPDVPSAGDPLASDVDANGRTGVISVTSGVTVTEVDAGLRGNNTVQGRVFYDRDGSFTQTGNDQDLSGATATLTVTVATVNLTTTYTLTATTGAGDPNYSFTGIPGGTSGVTYTLTFDPPDATYTPSLADVGGNDALDSDGPFIQVTGATVGVSNTLDYDQGYWRPVTVRARIFDEITNLPPDNLYSSGDTGITTATVTITTTNGTVAPLSSSGIDSTGVVTFTLPPTTTTYWLNVPTPTGFTPSPGNTGALEVNTPNPLLADATAPSPTTEFQFGYFRPGTVTGAVRFDRDGDNILFADNEPGMQGVTVTLRLGGSDVLTTTTDATGAYAFTGVLPANGYQVRVINPDSTNFLLVTPAAGDNDLQTPVGDDADTAAFNVAPGATVGGSSDAAVRGRATVTGQVWEDLNGNGVRDTGENVGALPGVTVNLTVTVALSGRLNTTVLASAVTDASGVYTFTNLPGGASAAEANFTLRFATPSGWFDTPADVGTQPATDDSDGIGTGVDQLDNQALGRGATETRDRGYYQAVTVVARVFEELTNLPPDNAYTLGDSGIPTATVTITTTGGPVTPLSVSSIDATGLITFTLVPTDSATPYWVNVAAIAGFERSPGNTGAAQVIPNPTSGQTVGPSGLEFGHYRVVTVVARVFEELTNLPPDNAYTLGDSGIPTATVTITTTGGPVTPLSVSSIDATGLITFTLVPTNSATPYWVNVAPITGFERSPGNTGAAQVIPNPAPGQTVGSSGLEFGHYRAVTVVARVFEENPPVDNVYQTGDTGITTATVTITTTNGPVTPLSVSSIDATGLITFTLVPTDSATPYWVNVAPIAGFERSPGNGGALEVTPNPGPGGSAGVFEFGHFRPGTVTGAVRFDRDADNDLFADNEPGMQGVTVTLWLSNSVVLTTTTDATGAYTFTNVTPNISYTVRVTNPDTLNFELVTPAGGDNDMATTDVGNTYAETDPFTVTAGATVGGLSDAAVRGRATVTGQVWEDLNGNGQRDGSEGVGALPGVTVALTVNVNLPGLLSTTITTNTTTNASGFYTFTALPGWANASTEVSFTLGFATPSGWFDTLADVGTQPATDDSDGIGTGVDQLDDQELQRNTTATRDRGYYRPAVIQVRVFEENPPVDNVYAAGDAPLSATITLTPNVVLSGPSAQDATGIITYTVAPTTTAYVIGVTTPAGYTPSPGNTGTTTVAAPLTSNTTYGPLPFGYFRPGTVTGAVRFDRDADNILFADNEPGMQGVTVTLWLSNSVVLTTTTDATGAYTFTNVTPAVSYTVRVTNPDTLNFLLVTPAGGDNDMATTDGGNTYAETVPFTVTSGAAISRTAAVRGRATVTGQVWEDLNGNGQRDAGEGVGALPGVTVALTVNVNLPGLLSTTITTNTTTNASGFYTFTALPGWVNVSTEVSFTLGFATPSGWFDTLADVGTQPATDDSDGIGTGVDQLNDQGLQRNTTATRDRGYYRPAVIQVRVFEETTPPINNVYAAGDAPIAGATVALTPNVTLGGPFGPDATGIISYTVTPTTTAYTVGVASVPAGYFPSPGNTGTATAPAPLISGQTISPLPFGYYRNGVISGTVWFDANVNGTFNTGEPTMAGVTVTLHLDPDATVNGNETLIGTFTTGDNGIYQFTNITPTDVLTTGTLYRVRFELPTGYVFTTQGAPITTDNNSDANTTNGYTDRFSVGSNETVTYVDAGAVGNLSLSGTTWEDVNVNGTLDAGEPSLPGVTLTLTVTTSINSTNPTVTYTVTSGAGSPNFTFNQLPAGNYQLSVTAKPLGYLLSTAGTLSGTLPATGQNFGLYRTAAVGDRVWLDVNGNGTYEAGVDAGLPGITVRLRDAATDVVISTTTTLAGGNAGFYGFENVTPGSYVVEFVVPSGFQTVNNGLGSLSVDNDNDAQSNGRTASFTLASNQISTTVDAGLIGDASISGIAWIDENFDDIRNPGETQRIPGVQVTLTITPTVLSSPLTLSTATNASGAYTFANLPPGTFVLTFTKPAGYFDITPRVGSDPTVDSDAPVATGTLGAGQSITTLDAGYRTQMRVFLPLVMVPVTPPDLVVEAFTVTPAKSSYAAGEPVLITVKVKNVGGSPTTVGFWVDLYINPSTPPTTPNVRWNDVCGISPCYGIAWYVNQSLAPGQSITLTSAPGQFAGPQSVWPGSFASGTNALYVYVDSYNPPVPTGAVVESNETNNRAQITGFVVAGASFSNGADSGAPSGAPDAPVALPPRELPGPVEP